MKEIFSDKARCTLTVGAKTVTLDRIPQQGEIVTIYYQEARWFGKVGDYGDKIISKKNSCPQNPWRHKPKRKKK